MSMLRTARIAAIKKVIARDEDPVLQELFMNVEILEVLSRRDIFDIWYGMKSLDSYDDSVLELMTILLRADVDAELKKLTKEKEKKEETRPLAKILPFRQADRKSEFLSDPSLSALVIQQTTKNFKEFEEYEALLGKDIADMTKEEFIAGVERREICNRETLRNLLFKTNKYLRWCRQNGYSSQSYKISVDDIDLVEAMRKGMISSPETLVQKLDKCCILNDGYVAPVCACLAWMGLDVDEMVKIKNEDYNPELHRIRDREIPEAFREIFRDYSGKTEVIRDRGPVRVRMRLENAGLFLKRVSPFNDKIPRALPKGYVSIALVDLDLRCRDIQYSGRYYELMELEKQRAISMDDVADVFGISESRTNRHVIVNDRYLEYIAFKKAFQY